MSAEVTLTVDEREALARIIWTTSRADEGTISATGANRVADAILASGWLAARVEQARADERKRCANAIEDDVNTHAQLMTPGERLGAMRAARVVRRLART